jgi:hypothetical protein
MTGCLPAKLEFLSVDAAVHVHATRLQNVYRQLGVRPSNEVAQL